jgi:NAD(P)-dependent dehydrogenase (short-subunit alcohol dehydrogenase family)
MNSPGDLAETQRLVEDLDHRCVALKADVRDAGQVQHVVDTALSEFGRRRHHDLQRRRVEPVDGGGDDRRAVEERLDMNLKGAFHSIRAAAAPMIEQNWGRIIVTCSNLGRQGMQNMANYCASRWGQLGLCEDRRDRARSAHITVNAVCPTMTETPQVTNDVLYRMFRPDLENRPRPTSRRW